MSKKVAVVTGGNKGIGYGIVKGLCEKFDGDVYLTARDEKRGLAAVKSLNDLGYQPKFHLLDITVTDSIQKLRDHLVEQYGGLDVLVNNAAIGDPVRDTDCILTVLRTGGVSSGFKKRDGVGIEHLKTEIRKCREIMKVNYFGFRNACNILFPILKPHARVVNITSCMGHLTNIPGKSLRASFASPDLTEERLNLLITNFLKAVQNVTRSKEGWPGNAYWVSKVGVSALSRIQQRELLKDKDRPDIVVNHVHPGSVDTDMEKDKDYPKMTIEQGAEAAVWLALLPENCTKPKGDFVWFTKEIVDWVNGPMPAFFLTDN